MLETAPFALSFIFDVLFTKSYCRGGVSPPGDKMCQKIIKLPAN